MTFSVVHEYFHFYFIYLPTNAICRTTFSPQIYFFRVTKNAHEKSPQRAALTNCALENSLQIARKTQKTSSLFRLGEGWPRKKVYQKNTESQYFPIAT